MGNSLFSKISSVAFLWACQLGFKTFSLEHMSVHCKAIKKKLSKNSKVFPFFYTVYGN